MYEVIPTVFAVDQWDARHSTVANPYSHCAGYYALTWFQALYLAERIASVYIFEVTHVTYWSHRCMKWFQQYLLLINGMQDIQTVASHFFTCCMLLIHSMFHFQLWTLIAHVIYKILILPFGGSFLVAYKCEIYSAISEIYSIRQWNHPVYHYQPKSFPIHLSCI